MSVVHGIRLGTGEQVIRQYEASRLAEPKATGYIIATNRRIIFTGNSESTLSSSIMVRDTKIDNITGVIGGITRERTTADNEYCSGSDRFNENDDFKN